MNIEEYTKTYLVHFPKAVLNNRTNSLKLQMKFSDRKELLISFFQSGLVNIMTPPPLLIVSILQIMRK